VRARLPFDAASGMATANGRPRRAAIGLVHAAELSLEPDRWSCDVVL
jgi:hypothetical protein